MIKLLWIFPAEYSVMAQGSNTISAFNILGSITAQTYPLLFPKIGICAEMMKGWNDEWPKYIIVTFKYHRGEEILRTQIELTLSASRNHRINLVVQGIVFAKPGLVDITLSSKFNDDSDEKRIGKTQIFFSKTEGSVNIIQGPPAVVITEWLL